MIYTIAVINPAKRDGLASTILDGLCQLRHNNSRLDFRLSCEYLDDLPLENSVLGRRDFVEYARSAHLIILIHGKNKTDRTLARTVGQWKKTVFVDGSEPGRNRRMNLRVQKQILSGKYRREGRIDSRMLADCLAYFRREKPYVETIVPLPFGIESKYVRYTNAETRKDIDFICVFGQDRHPPLRRLVRDRLVSFCQKHAFSCWVERTETPDHFYRLLARSKVGISVGGGGFDTRRFWEILGNNCVCLTENIDIYPAGAQELRYDRIWEFASLYDFNSQLTQIAEHLRKDYDQVALWDEYTQICARHSSVARVLSVLECAHSRNACVPSPAANGLQPCDGGQAKVGGGAAI